MLMRRDKPSGLPGAIWLLIGLALAGFYAMNTRMLRDYLESDRPVERKIGYMLPVAFAVGAIVYGIVRIIIERRAKKR